MKRKIRNTKTVYKRSKHKRSKHKRTTLCIGKKDGISGCRDCCNIYRKYHICIRDCMNN